MIFGAAKIKKFSISFAEIAPIGAAVLNSQFKKLFRG